MSISGGASSGGASSGSYLTVARDAVAEIEIKRSRFLATATRVESEAAAREVVATARKEHWDARHHCSAFVLGDRRDVQRSSDDGEPAGTAGAPILEAISGRELSDVVVVVTRWFGGILLGAGGLVRAYSGATVAALDAAGVLRRALLTEYAVEVDHAHAGRLESDLRNRGLEVLGADYAAAVRLRVALPAAEGESLSPLVAELAGAVLPVSAIGSRWVDLAD